MTANQRKLLDRSRSLFRLKKWWFDVFPDLQLPIPRIDDCPMLLGIMQHASGQRGEFPPFEYQCQVLQRCDVLSKTNTRSTLENVLETLRVFKDEWHRHQQFLLPFDVSRSTGLCPDVVIEISKYLSLIDTINAFSISILPVLRQAHSKVHLNNPSYRLLQMIPHYLDPRQISSVYIIDDIHRPTHHLSAFQIFDQLVSMTIFSQRREPMIGRLLPYFPAVRRLCLWFITQFDWILAKDLRDLSSHRITHLHIRCTGVLSDDFATRNQEGGYPKNITITSLIFDLTSNQVNRDKAYFFRRTPAVVSFNLPMSFIASLTNIRRVRLIFNRNQLQTFLQVNQWQQLIHECLCLNRVIIQLANSVEFTQDALRIERTLRLSRPGMIFRIINA